MVSRGRGLRTKEGCVQCRHDRKKCDEQKPSCGRCQRSKPSCSWPDIASLPDRRSRRRPKRSPGSAPCDTMSNNCSEGVMEVSRKSHSPSSASEDLFIIASQLFAPSSLTLPTALSSGQEYYLFEHFINGFYPKLLLPGAHSTFLSIIPFAARCALSDPSVNRISLACAAVHLYSSTGLSKYHNMALLYYGEALSSVRHQLQNDDVVGIDESEIVLLLTLSFLCIFSTWSQDRCSDIPFHVGGARQLLKKRFTSRRRIDISSDFQHIEQVLVESILYQTFAMCVNDPFTLSVNPDHEFWEVVVKELQQSTRCSPIGLENTPVLGVSLALYYLVFRITEFFRSLEPRYERLDEWYSLSYELELWKKRMGLDDEHVELDTHTPRSYDAFTALYILGASILLESARARMGDASSYRQSVWIVRNAVTRNMVRRATQILRVMNKGDPCSNCYLGIWALEIIGYAADSESDARAIREELERRLELRRSGDIERALSNLQLRCSERYKLVEM